VTRPQNDPLTNPQPGDVVRIGQGWTRRVVQRDAETVEFYSTFGKRSTGTVIGPYMQSIQKWVSESANAEVLNVAQQ